MKYRHFPAAVLAAGLLFCTLFSGLTAYADDKKGELTQKQSETRQEYEAAQSALEELQNEQTQTESEVAAPDRAGRRAGWANYRRDRRRANAQTVLDERQPRRTPPAPHWTPSRPSTTHGWPSAVSSCARCSGWTAAEPSGFWLRPKACTSC